MEFNFNRVNLQVHGTTKNLVCKSTKNLVIRSFGKNKRMLAQVAGEGGLGKGMNPLWDVGGSRLAPLPPNLDGHRTFARPRPTHQ